MEVSIDRKCECNNRLYKNLKAHKKTQKHQLYELKKENKNLRLLNKRQENEIYALKKALMVSMECNIIDS